MDLEAIVQALSQASSQTDTKTRKDGENQLKELAKKPNFLSGLLHVYRSDQTDMQTRWLAVIYFKNSIEHTWRKSAESNLYPEEKASIRSQLLNVAASPMESKLHHQFAVAMARIVKYDFPRAWPTYFEDLQAKILEVANGGNETALYNILVTAHQSIKSLSSVRIGPTRSKLMEHAAGIAKLTGDLYLHLMQSPSYENLVIAYSALKSTCTLIYDGHDRAHRSEVAREFFARTLDLLQHLLNMWHQQPPRQEILGRHIRRLGKLYGRLLVKRPVSFCLMPNGMQVASFYAQFLISKGPELLGVGEDSDSISFYDNMAIQGMIVLRELLNVVAKNPSSYSPALLPVSMRPRDEEDRQDLLTSYQAVSSQIFESNQLDSITYSLVSSWFHMRTSDVEKWKNDPEDYFVEESKASTDFKAASCARSLYHQILKYYPETSRQVLSYVNAILAKNGTEFSEILELDAALQCLEFGASSFSGLIDMETVLTQDLVPRIQFHQVDAYRIIRRRTCLAVAAWLPLSTNDNLRNLVYHLACDVIFAEHPLNDVAVQLAALHMVKVAVDDLDFSVEAFLEFAETTFAKIYSFLHEEVDSLEIKQHLFEVLGVLVEQLGSGLSDHHIHSILRIIPPLWDEVTENQLMKTAILQTLSNLVDSCKERSPICYDVAINCLTVSTDLRSPLLSYLLEDALPLWKALVANAPASNDTLTSLFPNLVNLMESATEYLAEELVIVESYMHLEPRLITDPSSAQRFFSLAALYLPTASLDVTMGLLACILAAVTLIDPHEFTTPLLESGLLRSLLEMVIGVDAQNSSMIAGIRAVRVLTIFAWLAYKSPDLLAHVFSFDQLSSLVREWLNKSNSVGEPGERKMNTLGVSSLIYQAPNLFLQYGKGYMDLWSLILEEVQEENGDAQVYHESESYGAEAEEDLNPELLRLRAERAQQPVHTVSMRTYLGQLTQMLRHEPQGAATLGEWSIR